MRLLAGLFFLVAAWTSSAIAAVPPLVIQGRGWGHGVGMSQWGAEGLATHGWESSRILAHYYPGTTLGRVAGGRVRVLLGEAQGRVRIGSRMPFRVTDALGVVRRLEPGGYITPLAGLRAPLRFEPGLAPLTLNGDGYRGALVVSGVAGSLTVVNDVSLERYLRGVVPWEMPYRWRQPALEAQAVAARTYALSQRQPDSPFDLYADTRDQVYGGIRAERASTNRAVGATAGRYLVWRGRPALAYYFSTSGGRTQSVADGLPWARQLPYLVSVDDPYDTASPHHRWGPVSLAPGRLARRLDLPGLRTIRPVLNSSGRVAGVDVTWRGGRRRIPGRDFQAALELRSTWFTISGGPDGTVLPPLRGAGPRAPLPVERDDWPATRRGYTLVIHALSAAEGPQAARALARKAAAAGVPATGVLESGRFGSLRAGFYVVFSGHFRTAAEAERAQARLPRLDPAPYVRLVEP